MSGREKQSWLALIAAFFVIVGLAIIADLVAAFTGWRPDTGAGVAGVALYLALRERFRRDMEGTSA